MTCRFNGDGEAPARYPYFLDFLSFREWKRMEEINLVL
jgi:hypothetical protein